MADADFYHSDIINSLNVFYIIVFEFRIAKLQD